jgi:hypothetical protein
MRWGGGSVALTFTGLVLIGSAFLKAYDVLSTPATSARLGTLGLLLAEWTLGVWLLSGTARRLAWGAAIIAFLGFAVYNVIQALAGVESCGCFGKLQIHPWYTSAFDACIVSALIIYAPHSQDKSTLHRWKLAALLVGLIGFPTLLAIAARPTAPPRYGLIADTYSHDFGTLKLSEAGSAEHVFTLRNTSDQPIRIIKSTSTCGCTVAEVPTEPVAPGASARVRVKADCSQRPGQQTEHVRLATDHAPTGTILISIEGNVRALASISPPAIHFGGLASGESATRLVLVRAAPQHNLRITNVEISHENVQMIRLDNRGKPNPSIALVGPAGSFQVVFRSTEQIGRHQAKVIFHTNLPDQPRVELPIRAEVKPPIVVIPASLLFHRSGTGYALQTVRIISRETPSLQIVEGDFVLERIRHAPDDDHSFEAVVRFTGNEMTLNQSGVLRVASAGSTRDVPLLAVGF